MIEKPIIPEKLLKDILFEKNKWKESPDSRTFNGNDKGKIIADIVKKHFKIDKNDTTDLNIILKELKLKIEYADLNEFNNNEMDNFKYVWGAWKGNTIYVSKHLKNLKAQRFTIAHELGHVFLDYEKNLDVFYRMRGVGGGDEVIINDFAANLLIPKINESFLKNFKKISTYKLSEQYKVPFDTITILAERYLNFLNREMVY